MEKRTRIMGAWILAVMIFSGCNSVTSAQQGSSKAGSTAQSASATDVVGTTADSSTMPVTFADEDLEIAVRRKIDKAEGDIFGSELETIASLVLGNKEITDISGIEHLVNLQTLHLNNTAVSDISDLAELTQLKYLDVSRTKVTDISALTNLTNLETLYLNNNQIAAIDPLAGLTRLKTLYLNDTLVSDISPLANAANLQSLNLRNTKIQAIDALAGLEGIKVCEHQKHARRNNRCLGGQDEPDHP